MTEMLENMNKNNHAPHSTGNPMDAAKHPKEFRIVNKIWDCQKSRNDSDCPYNHQGHVHNIQPFCFLICLFSFDIFSNRNEPFSIYEEVNHNEYGKHCSHNSMKNQTTIATPSYIRQNHKDCHQNVYRNLNFSRVHLSPFCTLLTRIFKISVVLSQMTFACKF